MYTHLRSQKEYEDRYDLITIEQGRRDMEWFWKAQDKFLEKVKVNGKDPKPKATEYWWSLLCYWLVELPLGKRWEERDQTIRDWKLEDEAKDLKLVNARPKTEPVCYHCGKTGLRITGKILSHKTEDYTKDEEVLIFFDCTHCHKNTSCWEDGELYQVKPRLCSKCKLPMLEKSSKKGSVIIDTYTCPVCKQTKVERLDLKVKKDKPDPNYERDKALYCFDETRGRKYLDYKVHWEDLHRLFERQKEKEANKDLYDAVVKLEKLKVAELIDKLKPVIEKEGYIEISFDKPEIARDFTVGFNCLDGQTTRSDYESTKTLKKTVKKALEQTNWRLMSEGISYRLGYLNGRIRAYEDEEQLLSLVSK